MKEYTYEGREIDHFTITQVPFSTLKQIIEEQHNSEDQEMQDLVYDVEEELTRRCDLLDMKWEMLDDELEVN